MELLNALVFNSHIGTLVSLYSEQYLQVQLLISSVVPKAEAQT